MNYDPDRDGADIKDLMGIAYKDIKFDKSLYKQLKLFRVNWTHKSVEYSEFLGGNTLGLQAIRFSSRDDEELMSGIYNVVSGTLYSNIIRLPDIQESWAVSTNPILQTLTYTMHRFITDGKMGRHLDDALRECYYIFAYKVLGSLMSNYFKTNTTPALAKATYERLSNRFLLKKLGTWNDLLAHRTEDIIPKKGLHYDRLVSYTTLDSVRVVNDLQGRIRETIKNIYTIFISVIEDGVGVKNTSLIDSSSNNEGDSTRDIVDRPDKYLLRINELIGNPINLIDTDLIYLINQFVKSSDIDIINKTLLELSESHNVKSKDADYLKYVILRTIAYCNIKGITSDYRDNIVIIINHMRGYWSSGSVKDKDVKLVKKVVGAAVKKSTRRKTKWVIASNSLAVIIYLFVRSIK